MSRFKREGSSRRSGSNDRSRSRDDDDRDDNDRDDDNRDDDKGRGRSRSRSSGRGRNTKSRDKQDTDLIRIGSITPSKKFDKDLIEDLIDHSGSLWCNIYLSKDENGKQPSSIKIQNGDKLLLTFSEPGEREPDYVMGRVSLKESD